MGSEIAAAVWVEAGATGRRWWRRLSRWRSLQRWRQAEAELRTAARRRRGGCARGGEAAETLALSTNSGRHESRLRMVRIPHTVAEAATCYSCMGPSFPPSSRSVRRPSSTRALLVPHLLALGDGVGRLQGCSRRGVAPPLGVRRHAARRLQGCSRGARGRCAKRKACKVVGWSPKVRCKGGDAWRWGVGGQGEQGEGGELVPSVRRRGLRRRGTALVRGEGMTARVAARQER